MGVDGDFLESRLARTAARIALRRWYSDRADDGHQIFRPLPGASARRLRICRGPGRMANLGQAARCGRAVTGHLSVGISSILPTRRPGRRHGLCGEPWLAIDGRSAFSAFRRIWVCRRLCRRRRATDHFSGPAQRSGHGGAGRHCRGSSVAHAHRSDDLQIRLCPCRLAVCRQRPRPSGCASFVSFSCG